MSLRTSSRALIYPSRRKSPKVHSFRYRYLNHILIQYKTRQTPKHTHTSLLSFPPLPSESLFSRLKLPFLEGGTLRLLLSPFSTCSSRSSEALVLGVRDGRNQRLRVKVGKHRQQEGVSLSVLALLIASSLANLLRWVFEFEFVEGEFVDEGSELEVVGGGLEEWSLQMCKGG